MIYYVRYYYDKEGNFYIYIDKIKTLYIRGENNKDIKITSDFKITKDFKIIAIKDNILYAEENINKLRRKLEEKLRNDKKFLIKVLKEYNFFTY